jgi:hypothetical protein
VYRSRAVKFVPLVAIGNTTLAEVSPMLACMKSQAFTCLAKIRFATHREAELQRFAHEENRHVDKGEMRTYRCRHCGSFHNGHREPRSRKAELGYLLQVGEDWHKTRVAFTIGDRLIESWREK